MQALALHAGDWPAHLGQCRSRYAPRLNARRSNVAAGAPVAAHAHPVAGAETGQVCRCQCRHFLTHHLQLAAGCIHRIERPDQAVNRGNAARHGLRAAACRRHGHDLADQQLAGRARPPAVPHRRGRVVLHFDAVDADAGKAADHADDASATDAAFAEARRGGHGARAAHAADASRQAGLLTGAAYAARVTGRASLNAGAAQATGVRVDQRGLGGADVARRCL